jgi:hypothetical protein
MMRTVLSVLVALVVSVWMFGAELSCAQSTSSGSGSEATIRQVASTPATSEIADHSELPEDQVIYSLVGNLGSTGLGLGPYTGEISAGGQQVVIRQQGTGNTASVDQRGTSNVAQILHLGNDNATTVTQRGRRNAAGVVLDGNRNDVSLLQQGNGHKYLLGFQGSDLDLTGKRMRMQKGSNNRLIELGQNSIPFDVRQEGSGMTMIIRHYGSGPSR